MTTLNNPPVPPGYQLLKQLAVTPAMTAWAVTVLRDPASYPMFASVSQSFGALNLLARVEWHPPDFQNHQVHRGITLYEPTVGDLAQAAATNGVDVSGYQPHVDWAAVPGSGVSFAFIKATESTTLIDHHFQDHWQRAKEAKFLRSAYHFFRPKIDALAQARFFLDQLADPGELPPVLDVEVLDGAAPAALIAGVEIWLDYVGARLGRPIVYTSPGFWNQLPSNNQVGTKADLWVAHWGARSPAAVQGFGDWKFWQYTNQATIAGIPGTGAMDEDRFNGSLAELRAYSAEFISKRGRPAATAFNLGATRGVQQALNFLGLSRPPLDEDGIAGPNTKAAVEKFQKQAGIAVDGIVGPNTIRALQMALQAPRQAAQSQAGGVA